MEPVEEGSAITFRVRFFGQTGDPSSPDAISYLIKDLTNDRVVRDWTSISTGEVVDIEVIASDNNLFNTNPHNKRRFEDRSIVVKANPDTDTQYVKEALYRVRNQRGWES